MKKPKHPHLGSEFRKLVTIALSFSAVAVSLSFAAFTSFGDDKSEPNGPALMDPAQKKALVQDLEDDSDRPVKTAQTRKRAQSIKETSKEAAKSDAEKKYWALIESFIQFYEQSESMMSFAHQNLKNRVGQVWFYPESENRLLLVKRHRILLQFDYKEGPLFNSEDPYERERCDNAEMKKFDVNLNRQVLCGTFFRAWRYEPGSTRGSEIGSGLTFRDFVVTMEKLALERDARYAAKDRFLKNILSADGEIVAANVMSFGVVAGMVAQFGKPEGPKRTWPDACPESRKVVWDTPANRAYAASKNIKWPPRWKEVLIPPQQSALEMDDGPALNRVHRARIEQKYNQAKLKLKEAMPAERNAAMSALKAAEKEVLEKYEALRIAPPQSGFRRFLPSALTSKFPKSSKSLAERLPNAGFAFKFSGRVVKFVPQLLHRMHKEAGPFMTLVLWGSEAALWYQVVADHVRNTVYDLYDASEEKIEKDKKVFQLIRRAHCYTQISEDEFNSKRGAVCTPEDLVKSAEWGGQIYGQSSTPQTQSRVEAGDASTEAQNEVLNENTQPTLNYATAYERIAASWKRMTEQLKKNSNPTLEREKADADYELLDAEIEKIMNRYRETTPMKKTQ